MLMQEKEMNDEIKVGDIITAYNKGYHEVIALLPNNVPLIRYRLLLTSNFKERNGAVNVCHVSYCRKVTFDRIDEDRQKVLDDTLKGYARLSKILQDKENEADLH